jgi:type II secretory pathway pseudopilin PulG
MIFKIFNSGAKQDGFTLVELLASVVILVAIGSVIAGIISSSLRGSNKTDNIESVRQNGNYALNQISKDIEYTLPFDGENTGLSADDGETYTTGCPPQSFDPTPIPAEYTTITVESVSHRITKYKCATTPPTLLANDNPLINTALVSLYYCSFTCVQNRVTDIPVIKISFSIGPKKSNDLDLVENSSKPIVFETSVTIRNYNR